MNFNQNNLDKSISPYLRQHKDNPIHWQEWNNETLAYAKEQNKLIFLSIGYATCHWCHVMAGDAFSNEAVAHYLNKHFVCIKVDREQRPDIDDYMMAFIQQTQGQGGWPLNVVLTPNQTPFFAATYMPAMRNHHMVGITDILEQIRNAYEQHKHQIKEFMPLPHIQNHLMQLELIQAYITNFDKHNAGFGYGMKFPPHNTLLFLLHFYEHALTTQKTDSPIANNFGQIKIIIEQTLDTMAASGLHDHLQGGFYRYCVDSSWTIPHFEKMLYDQAMLLWVYALGYKVLKKPTYKMVVLKIMQCLEETFQKDNLYYSAHDADTNHNEGETYLWTIEELKQILTADEFSQLEEVYHLPEGGNFEGTIHLTKKNL